ncbi:MAG: metallophosphoesterase [Synergistaceae bacterium]|nr:metallophosphoesterase [Synergistaceae bacterium]
MYEILCLGALLFICRKLNQAGISKLILKIFMLTAFLWLTFAFFAGFDLRAAEYDFFPLHFNEMMKAVNMTLIIISLYGFMSFFAVDMLTKFKGFTKLKALCALALMITVTIYSMYEAYNVQRRDITIPTTKLPEGVDKIRVVFLVDVHLGGLYTLNHFERVMKIVDEASPDIILLGGDIIDGDMSYQKTQLEMLRAAAKKARYGAFAVNGNHEHYLILDEDVEGIIREYGYDLLIDERRETAGITIIGMEDVKYGWLKIFERPEDKNRFVLVLKHRPGIPVDAEGRFDLQLSGHTHGGQFWPLGYFKNMALNSRQGLTRREGGYVYVSNGVGYNSAMMRLFVPPEVTVIDIVREK